jgi:urate oxidase
MKFKPGNNAYGKNAVNLSKIIRHKEYHEFRQISVNIALEGDFETVHTLGDNSKILPTDTQKNTVYALAKEHFTDSIEGFGLYLANHFTSNNAQLSQVKIEITEHLYHRPSFNGVKHPHAYVSSGNEKRTTQIIQNAHSITVTSGIKDLLILKTTDSAFYGYIKDPYTTLQETNDRILATQCEASWVYDTTALNFDVMFAGVRLRFLETFAFHKSLSVQQTLYAIGEDILKENEHIKKISIIMSNKHHIPFNLHQFGIENDNEIFIATDEPYGYITGTVERD